MPASRQRIHIRKAEGTEIPGNREHAEQESGIANAIHDECFIGRIRCRLAMEVKADQQVGAQAHTFPAHKHHGVVVPQDQRQHGKHEQIHVSEEAVVAAFVRHVADRVDVDQHADAGHEQQPDARELVEQEPGIGVERRHGLAVMHYVVELPLIHSQPGVKDCLVGLMTVCIGPRGVLPDRPAGPKEGNHYDANADDAGCGLLQLAAEKEHHRRAEGGEQRDQPDMV